MTVPMVLLPVFVLVALAFVLLLSLAPMRAAALRSGKVDVASVALDDRQWHGRAQQFGNAFKNQFEVPVLFYALVAFALITRQTDFLFVALSWVFVASRLVHAFIHVTSNNLSVRGPAFGFGVLMLAVMWIIFAVRILASV
ncbi:MAG: MAPEG family protein [Chelatococcus sp.]|uniref:MAPEG family protein n=1 Tax=Chelatococcus sp. TaxID=1953771 RepID=UPI0025C6E965|nr:MAPEG family protein [Chelatococcus sp.]MBX3538977.1 MAPEG family protein [Chelatococcus sp.]